MLEDRDYIRESEYRPHWLATLILIAVNVVIFILQTILDSYEVRFTQYLGLSWAGIKSGLVYQLFTFQFLHGGLFHLLGNMVGLFFLGRIMESLLGRRNFLALYFLSGTLGGVVQIVVGLLLPSHAGGLVVGASAGVSGLLAAFATHAPEQPLALFPFPITIRARTLIYLDAAFAILGLILPPGRPPYIAHAAHLGGLAVGILFMKWLNRSNHQLVLWRPFRRRSTPRSFATTPSKRHEPWTPKVVEPELPPEEFMTQEVDPILDKISAHGLKSLTDRERQILEAARKKMAKK